MVAKTPAQTPATPKAKKPAVPVVKRVTDQMKKAALGNKLSAEELDTIANLANALKAFIAA